MHVTWFKPIRSQRQFDSLSLKFIWASKTRVRASKCTISLPDRASENFEKRRALAPGKFERIFKYVILVIDG